MTMTAMQMAKGLLDQEERLGMQQTALPQERVLLVRAG